MKRRSLLTHCALLLLLACPAVSGGEDYLLYTPKPAAGDQVPASPDQGVLVHSVTVKRGDTLKKLSRKHIGVGSYFPQVLVFNTVKNPDLIHPGDKLFFPVRPGHTASSKTTSEKKPEKKQRKQRHAARRHAHAPKGAVEQASSAAPATHDEQETYHRARRAYLLGDCQKALDLFDSFLRRFPNSKLAPDASLYRADCLLRLSGQ